MRKAETTSVLACCTMVYGRTWRGALTPQLDSAMPLPPLIGHERVKTRLAGAHASGKLPQALLLAGPRGVGKQRLALWLAQLIHCEGPGGGQGPLGQCRPGRLGTVVQHPEHHAVVAGPPCEPSGEGVGEAAPHSQLR